ncbi:MAG: carbamate kinase [Bacteroidales bacterium]|jgi:carbamate kinase|nr:carbamate kinase [Bacteroidales bacterium]
MSKLAVIALGGNALLRGDQRGTIEEQEQNTLDTMENIVEIIKEGYNLVISHGNGPQVGNILMQHDAGAEKYDIPAMPLDYCVAESQGGIGYMLEKALRNTLKKHGINKEVVTLVTNVVVDKNDEAFTNLTKRVGRIYTKEQADALKAEKGWQFKEEVKADGGWRRVVASPKPVEVMNEKIVQRLASEGVIVIATGGGGIPVSYNEDGTITSQEAVIDKDSANSLLASRIKADEFYVLTDVPYVYINFKQPNEKKLDFLDRADTLKYIEDGMFAEGSMAPKIRASLNFVENGGKKSVITEATKLVDRSFGTKITLNYED